MKFTDASHTRVLGQNEDDDDEAHRAELEQHHQAPKLVALVYRQKTGCKQYAFETVRELDAWTRRHPYRNEVLRVMPVSHDGKFLHDLPVNANDAATFVTTCRAHAACNTPRSNNQAPRSNPDPS